MAAVDLLPAGLRPPQSAPGEKVVDMLKRVPIRFKSNTYTDASWSGDATEAIFNIPANALIADLMVVITGAVAGATISVGDGADVDRFMDTTAVGTAVGSKSMKLDSQPGSGGTHMYTAADTIDLTIVGTPTAGTIAVYVDVIFNANELDGFS